MKHCFNKYYFLFSAAITLIVFYLWKEYTLNGRFGFPLDDSWIHLQFAKNIGTGKGFSYNAGVPVAGSTAPLWTFILSIPFACSINPVLFSKIAGVVFYLLSLFFFIKIYDLENSKDSTFASLLFILTSIFIWSSISGMEIMLCTALVLSGIYYHLSTRNILTYKRFMSTVLLSLAGFARPECFVLVPIVFMDDLIILLFFQRGKDNIRRDFIGKYICGFTIWIIFILFFCWFNYQFDGKIFPNTFYAKAGTPPGDMNLFQIFWLRVLYGFRKIVYTLLFWRYYYTPSSNILFFMGFLPGLVLYVYNNFKKRSSDKITFLPVLLIFLYPFFMGAASMKIRIEDTLGRYVTHISAMYIFISAYGLLFIKRKLSNKYLSFVFMSVLFLGLLIELINFSGTYAKYVQNIEQMQVRVAEWVQENTKEEDVIALNDVGAIKYLTNRKIIDTLGLVTTEILPYIRKYSASMGMIEYISEKKPDYLIAFPNWYPIIPRMSKTFIPVFSAKLSRNYVCGGSELIVYKCNWEKM